MQICKPTIATIDPGIRGTGIAIWDMAKWKTDTLPLATYVITPPQDEEWVTAINSIFPRVREIFEKHNVQKSYCEFPQYFTSGVGHAATADGGIYKLSCLVGVFMGMMLERNTVLIPVKVTTWKGQLPKSVVEKRLIKREPKLAKMSIDSHAWDAVGVAYYKKGMFTPIKIK